MMHLEIYWRKRNPKSEFTNNAFKELLREHSVSVYYSKVGGRAPFAESVIRTLRNMIHKWMDDNNSVQWSTVLQEIVDYYNKERKHSSIKMTPELAKGNIKNVREILHLKAEKRFKRLPDLSVGDRVRKVLKRKTFSKGNEHHFSSAVYEVESVVEGGVFTNNRYKLKGTEGEYKWHQLLKIDAVEGNQVENEQFQKKSKKRKTMEKEVRELKENAQSLKRKPSSELRRTRKSPRLK